MGKKQMLSGPSSNWNPADKEPWHHEFDKEPVNDERWTCIVTAVIPAQPEDEECIRIFRQGVASGLRRAIKVISMTDVASLLMGKNKSEKEGTARKSKRENSVKSETNEKNLQPPGPRDSPIVNLVGRYATYAADGECKLPPDLMAAVLKYVILNMKDVNIFQKKVEAVRKRKLRERDLRLKFAKSIKPFKASEEIQVKNRLPNGRSEPLNDESRLGPDLYLVLIDFYDPFYFHELYKINVPFVAILKIANSGEVTCGKGSHTALAGRTEQTAKKEGLISNFWTNLVDNCSTFEKTIQFKDFLLMQYQPGFLKTIESKQQMRDTIFDEMSSMLYAVFSIYRQHQTYLSELHVQEVCLSLEPLDLSKCTVYGKLCDALVTGAPNTVVLVLYCMIEQVVVGVPPTENVLLKYEPRPSEYFPVRAHSSAIPGPPKKISQIRDYEMVTPCFACRKKKAEPKFICQEPSATPNNERDAQILFHKNYEDNAGELTQEKETVGDEESRSDGAVEFGIADSVLDEFLSGQASGVLKKNKASWKSPVCCFYGDKFTLHNYHCDSRLIDSESVVTRFLHRTSVPQLWAKYPDLPPGKKAFYEYHFFRLLQLTKDSRDILRIKFFFLHAMKLIGISSSYLYKGEEETLSELFRTGSREKTKRWSKVKFDRYEDTRFEPLGKTFSACVFRPYIKTVEKKVSMKAAKIRAVEKQEKSRASFLRADSSTLRKAVSLFNVSLATYRNSGYCFSYFFKLPESSSESSPMNPIQFDKEFSALLSLLDCYDISNLSESHMLNSEEDYLNLVKNVNFYECLEPRRMVQRLLEAQEDFSTTQCSYIAPTDTLIVLLHNDSDHRGVLFTTSYGTLSTPVSLRDFYSHVYLEIGEWLQTEKSDYAKFAAEVEEKEAKEAEKCKKDYVAKLKKKFGAMSADDRAIFLSSEPMGEVEVAEDELCDLPPKPKPECPNRVSYLATDFTDLRIETERKVKEFHSRDGTEINVLVDSWLYNPSRLLTLKIAQSQLKFLYHQYLGEDFESTFLFRTRSDMNFVFWKEKADDESKSMFRMKLSLPTGLMIRNNDGKPGPFIKQHYLNVYKKWWDLQDEKCRWFLTSGQVVIFYEDGDVEILCASGTRHILKDFKGNNGSPADDCHIRTTTSTGDVWEKSNAGRCRNKRKLVDSVKLFIGVDPKTQETYYRRDDGVSSMLWPNGKLVTHFSDGTKITSTPCFDLNEISVEWTQEEKLFIQHIVSSYREERAEFRPKSKTILKRPSPDSLPGNSSYFSDEKSSCQDNGFVSITVSYLIEHPKYSTVYSELQKPDVKVTMPGRLSAKIHPDGSYLLNLDEHYLSVQKDSVKFYTVCPKCDTRSTASIFFDPDDVLCKFVDMFGAVFYVYRSGETTFLEHENDKTNDNAFVSPSRNDERQDLVNVARSCPKSEHMKSMSSSQRCFVLERNLSGIEFLHNETLARHCYNLPEDTFYDLHAKGGSDSVLTHVFSSPHWRAGYEDWIMDYEEKDNSLPTNLRRRDLKEMGARDNLQNLFKYPFLKNQTGSGFLPTTTASIQEPPKLPKVIVTRIVKCISQNPNEMIDELKEHIAGYQAQAYDIINEFKKRKTFGDGHNAELEDVKNKLEQLALSFKEIVKPEGLYKHTSTVVPSTDFDIHNSAHHIHKMNELSSFNLDFLKNWTLCPQLSLPISALGGLKPVDEDADYSDED